ncbi:MAG: hypothetical protein ABJC39_06850 [Chloroflexota bacterium]
MTEPRGKTYVALGYAYSAVIAIVLPVIAVLAALWFLGIVGPPS